MGDNNVNNKNYIIINDLRAGPILAAIKLKYNITNTSLIAHQNLFRNREYADFTNNGWKALLKITLMIFFKLKIIPSVTSEICESELIGVFSSLVSITEDSMATEAKYPDIYNQQINLAKGAKDLENYLTNQCINSIFLFNGRGASIHLVAKFCVRNAIRVYYYEYAAHGNGFRLYPSSPHGPKALGLQLYKYFKYGLYNLHDIKVAANKFRHEKLNSSFAKKNKISPDKKYDVVIFLGSDYEYAWIDSEITGALWAGNIDFCESVFNKYGKEKTYAIRCHPNSINDPSVDVLNARLYTMSAGFGGLVDIYKPNMAVDSHQLIKNSNIVVTAYSSISLDAIILGVPVDIFFDSDIKYFYEDIWMSRYEGGHKNTIVEAFSLQHNFLVFRFSITEKFFFKLLYLVNRLFEKYFFWKRSCFYKK
jgi:hypothetical protein